MITNKYLWVWSFALSIVGSMTGWMTMVWLKNFNNIVIPDISIDLPDASLEWYFMLYKEPALVYLIPSIYVFLICYSAVRKNIYVMIVIPFVSLLAPMATIALLYCN